jgi:D-alanine-D-alanine ligase-like ATP-grasp enzyme
MSTTDEVPPLVSLFDRVGRTGRPGRELAVRLDLLRTMSMPRAWRRFAQTAKRARSAAAARSLEPAYQTIWREAAREVGAELVELPRGFIEMRAGDSRTRVWRHWVMLDDAVTLRYALQKGLVQERLSASGLPVPEHLEFEGSNLAAAEDFLERSGAPCVVKPAGESGGSGVSCGVRTRSNLMRARLRAWRLDDRLLIERQIAGDNYRFLFLDGVLLDVIRRRPPRVTGDGRSTIEELIEAENARRLQREQEVLFWRLDIDLDCIFTLEGAGLTVSSVLPAGETVAVKAVVNQNTIDDNETVREPIADALVAEARAAAELIGVRLAGIDLVTSDLSRSLADSGGAILEVNGTPGLHYHYEVVDAANATRVAVPILQALLDPARASAVRPAAQRP